MTDAPSLSGLTGTLEAADRALYERIKAGIEVGPGFRNKAHLRGALLALYDYIESDTK